MIEKYINPFTDYGFKRLFGEEAHKALLLDFLNELLREEQGEIKSIRFLKSEQLGATEIDRKAIFDVYCENDKGEKFIVELQKSKQDFFKDRALYYSTFPIQEQAIKGSDWNYSLKAIYTVAILDFVFAEDKYETDKYKYVVKLSDIETHKVFYNKLTFVYLEMPKFTKTLSEISTHFEKWLYVLKHLNHLDNVPTQFNEKVFTQLFEVAEIAKFNREQLMQYENSLKYYRDLKNSFDTARDTGWKQGLLEGRLVGKAEGILEGKAEGILEGKKEGKAEGKEEGILEAKIEIAKTMLQKGLDTQSIMDITGLSELELIALNEL